MDIGIKGIGTYIPKTFLSAADLAAATGIPEDVIARKFGIVRKPVPGPGDTPSAMALEAARTAVQRAGIDPADIGLVIWNGGQHKDYPCWLAGLKVAHELGARRAWSFDMEAMCGSMMAALEVGRSMLQTRPSLRYVLIASGYRNGDLIDPKVPETRFMLDIGAGGAAVVLEAGVGSNVLLGTAFRGDGSFSEDCVVPVMGARSWPPKPEDLARLRFEVRDEEGFKKKLNERTMPNFYSVIRESLAESGLTDRQIDYLAILHFKRSAHDAVLKELGLRGDQTTYLDQYGHLGQNDQILSIELGLQAGRIKDGAHIVMVGAGLGFVWAAAVVRWGPDGGRAAGIR
jgi:3-oxoacyl-[acyl-carrier-protein] synthase III